MDGEPGIGLRASGGLQPVTLHVCRAWLYRRSVLGLSTTILGTAWLSEVYWPRVGGNREFEA